MRITSYAPSGIASASRPQSPEKNRNSPRPVAPASPATASPAPSPLWRFACAASPSAGASAAAALPPADDSAARVSSLSRFVACVIRSPQSPTYL